MTSPYPSASQVPFFVCVCVCLLVPCVCINPQRFFFFLLFRGGCAKKKLFGGGRGKLMQPALPFPLPFPRCCGGACPFKSVREPPRLSSGRKRVRKVSWREPVMWGEGGAGATESTGSGRGGGEPRGGVARVAVGYRWNRFEPPGPGGGGGEGREGRRQGVGGEAGGRASEGPRAPYTKRPRDAVGGEEEEEEGARGEGPLPLGGGILPRCLEGGVIRAPPPLLLRRVVTPCVKRPSC